MGRNKDVKEKSSALITDIEIKKLFGRYDYNLKIPSTEGNDISKIGILYGDNGTGKTTILKLLFHLLSPAQDRWHRTFLTRVPFSRFSVVFSDRTKINVVREKLKLTGPYAITFAKGGRSSMKGKIELDEERQVAGLSAETERLLDEIANLGLSIIFLRDDRRLQSDEFQEESEARRPERFWDYERRRPYHFEDRDPRDIALRQSLERTTTWLRQRLIQASSQGEAQSQNIYATIVETINKAGVPKTEEYGAEGKKLIEELKTLDARSGSLTEFGLISRVNVERLIKGLIDTNERGLPFVAQVVRSFIDGQKARLNALEELNRLLSRFVKLINEFLVDKNIHLEVGEGISIITDSGTSLEPENLSSGEKQLLLLFCNVLASSESASLFIIDEPELSLNVKWQRRLMDALIDITSGSQCQFLLATHSIELLTKHRNQVIKLNLR